MHPTYGDVRLCGMDLFLQPEDAREVLGYMPDFAPVPTDLKAWEFLDLFAHSHGLGNTARRRATAKIRSSTLSSIRSSSGLPRSAC